MKLRLDLSDGCAIGLLLNCLYLEHRFLWINLVVRTGVDANAPETRRAVAEQVVTNVWSASASGSSRCSSRTGSPASAELKLV